MREILRLGQSWEIDEPGFSDIYYDNFINSALDNTNSVVFPNLDDVAMAMGWDFSLTNGQTAAIDMVLSTTLPTTSLYLTQQHLVLSDFGNGHDVDYQFYLSSTLTVTGNGNGNGTVPEPSMLLLLGVGLAGMVVTRRKVKV